MECLIQLWNASAPGRGDNIAQAVQVTNCGTSDKLCFWSGHVWVQGEQWCPVLFPDSWSRDVKLCCCKSGLGKAAGCTKIPGEERGAAYQLCFVLQFYLTVLLCASVRLPFRKQTSQRWFSIPQGWDSSPQTFGINFLLLGKGLLARSLEEAFLIISSCASCVD